MGTRTRAEQESHSNTTNSECAFQQIDGLRFDPQDSCFCLVLEFYFAFRSSVGLAVK